MPRTELPNEFPGVTTRGAYDPQQSDLDQALTAARMRQVMPPAVFSLVGAILARLLAADQRQPGPAP